MLNQKRVAMSLGLTVIASMLLGACAPTSGTPAIAATAQVIIQTQIVTVAGTPEVHEVVVTATPGAVEEMPAGEYNSADPTSYLHVTFGDIDTLDPALDYETAGGTVLINRLYRK